MTLSLPLSVRRTRLVTRPSLTRRRLEHVGVHVQYLFITNGLCHVHKCAALLLVLGVQDNLQLGSAPLGAASWGMTGSVPLSGRSGVAVQSTDCCGSSGDRKPREEAGGGHGPKPWQWDGAGSWLLKIVRE